MTRRFFSLLFLLAFAASGCSGCGKKAELSGPPPEVTGLATVPANAEGVIGADIAKLADSPIVDKAIEQLLVRDAALALAWKQVREGCKINVVKQVKRIMLVLGPTPPGGRAGTGPSLMVAIGNFPESDIAECVGKLVGKGNGQITGKPIGQHTLYSVKDGARAMFFAFGRSDTVVLGNNEAYVTEAIGAGKKAPDDAELASLLRRVDQNLPLWAVGRVDERVRKGLKSILTDLQAGPMAVYASLDPTDGAKVTFGAVMASAEDAKRLESWANNERALAAMVAQKWSLGTVVSKVTIQATDNVVQFKAPLDMADVNQLLSVLDAKGTSKQDSPPAAEAPGSGSAK